MVLAIEAPLTSHATVSSNLGGKVRIEINRYDDDSPEGVAVELWRQNTEGLDLFGSLGWLLCTSREIYILGASLQTLGHRFSSHLDGGSREVIIIILVHCVITLSCCLDSKLRSR